MILIDPCCFGRARITGERFTPVLAFGVWTLSNDDKIGMKKCEKCGGSKHFWSREYEGEKVSTRAGTGVDVTGHFTFDDSDTKGGGQLAVPLDKERERRGFPANGERAAARKW